MAKLTGLPAELQYEIVAEVVAEYVDRAITCIPVVLGPVEVEDSDEDGSEEEESDDSNDSAEEDEEDEDSDEDAPSDSGDDEESDGEEGDDDEHEDVYEESPCACYKNPRLRAALRKWEDKDREEKLPPNTIKPLLAACRDLRETTMTVLASYLLRESTHHPEQMHEELESDKDVERASLAFLMGTTVLVSDMASLLNEEDFPGFPEPLVEMIQGLHQLLLKSLEVKRFPQCGPENRNTKAALEMIALIVPQIQQLKPSSYYADVRV
ncbi:unnamed protein product [Cyclocybe aegerita]|uniref:Uncharacterized protein n=1 Tax=Cyclocybe aegerita TaxID=1973307 RepID=A0A8S0WTM0_CYCAE|nr:unnamed protein product [Cyclocybe aegerita]